MPRHEKHPKVDAAGEVTHVFGHRFVVNTGSKSVLADLTPRGLEIVELHVGDRVAFEGEQKPSEVKMSKLERNGETFKIDCGPHDKREHEADPAIAIKAAEHAGYRVIGGARRKPKQFELLGQKGALVEELHIEIDGRVRKTKPISADDRKWQTEMERERTF